MIGKTIWIFDGNYRIYKDDKGNKTSSPNYRLQWRPYEVVGETRQSWLLEYNQKVFKNRDKQFYCISQEEVDNDVWVNDHAHQISDRVRYIDAEKLRKVAEIIGYEA